MTFRRGDWIEAFGIPTMNQRGYLTLTPTELRIIASGNMAEYPEDPGSRRRNRFTDIEGSQRFIERAQMTLRIRRFLETEGFIEISTPVLQNQYGGADAEAFTTVSNTHGEQFLRISPELYLIMMIAGGLSQIYEIGPAFRNEGCDRTHNPEFTMLELYRVGEFDLIELTQRLIESALGPIEFHQMTMQEAVYEATGINFTGDRLIRAFERYAEPNLTHPTIITHFPAETSPLARIAGGAADRFEIYIGGMEIANGYFSQTDAEALSGLGLDPRYLAALETGLPPIGGLGIGIDRLAMLATGTNDIRDIIPYPYG